MNTKNILAGPWFQSASPQQAIEPVLTVSAVRALKPDTLNMLRRVWLATQDESVPCVVTETRRRDATVQFGPSDVTGLINSVCQYAQNQMIKQRMEQFRTNHDCLKT